MPNDPMFWMGEGGPAPAWIFCVNMLFKGPCLALEVRVQEVSKVLSPNRASHLSLVRFAVQTSTWAICNVGVLSTSVGLLFVVCCQCPSPSSPAQPWRKAPCVRVTDFLL